MSITTAQTVPVTDYLRIRQAASFIGMSAAFLRKEARLGRGPERFRCGKILLYTVAGLQQYMATRLEKAA